MTYEQAVPWSSRSDGARFRCAADVRVDSPYAGYTDFPVKLIPIKRGDLAARFVVRINELFESYRLIHEILDKMPGRRAVGTHATPHP